MLEFLWETNGENGYEINSRWGRFAYRSAAREVFCLDDSPGHGDYLPGHAPIRFCLRRFFPDRSQPLSEGLALRATVFRQLAMEADVSFDSWELLSPALPCIDEGKLLGLRGPP